MDIDSIIKALTKDALYTYEFDVTTGIAEKDLIDRQGVNYTEALGLKAPCSFDEMVKRSFGDFLGCRYTSDSYIRELSCKSLLHAYECGRRKLEANLHQAGQYVRLTYFLSQNPGNNHVKAFVVSEDITDMEIWKHEILTKEKNDLTQERNDLTEERDVLTEENIELTRAADAVHAMLKAGSYVCAYSPNGDKMLGIKYSEALRKLYGYSDEKDFPDIWESWMNCIVPEDREYVENSYLQIYKEITPKFQTAVQPEPISH